MARAWLCRSSTTDKAPYAWLRSLMSTRVLTTLTHIALPLTALESAYIAVPECDSFWLLLTGVHSINLQLYKHRGAHARVRVSRAKELFSSLLSPVPRL